MRNFIIFVCMGVASVLAAAQVPQAGHVVVVLEENHSFSSVVGSPAMPLSEQPGFGTVLLACCPAYNRH